MLRGDRPQLNRTAGQDLLVLVRRDLDDRGLVLTRLDRTDDPRLQSADDLVLLQHRKVEQHRDAIAKERDDADFPRSERERSGWQNVGLLEPGRVDAIAEEDRARLSTYSEWGRFVGHGLRPFNSTSHEPRPTRVTVKRR